MSHRSARAAAIARNEICYFFRMHFKTLLSFGAGAVVVILVHQFFLEVHKVTGSSMEPNFFEGDRVMTNYVDRFTLLSSFHRFDVVVLRCPKEPSKRLIKRIVALPGETIEMRCGNLWINGSPMTSSTEFLSDTCSFRPLCVRPDSFFVLGDNRTGSFDSRSFGCVHRDFVVGKTVYRYWPLLRFSFF